MWNETLDITRYDALAREAAAVAPRDRNPNSSTLQRAGTVRGGHRVLLRGADDSHDLRDRAVLHGLCESLQRADPEVRITISSARTDLDELPGVVRVQPRGALGRLAPFGAAPAQQVVIDATDLAWHAPDAAFALTPAPDEAARRYLYSLGLEPHGPIIGVAIRGFHPPDGLLPHWLREWVGLGRDEDDLEVARVLDQVARAIETLARRLHAAVVLLPASNEGLEADSPYCHELAAMLELPCVRVAKLDDPRLYQAVCGRLKLMISARSHPLILAAGMGVPGIGLGHDGLFKDCFDPLGVPRRVIGTDEIRDGLQAESIVALAEDALDDPTDLRARSEGLRRRVHEAVAARLDRRDPEPGTPAVPARPAAPARPAPAWPPPERSLPQLR
jgi:hypothetical protein